jgi:photosystem II stability/assembly factor-like uncharacterized protein
LSDYTTDTISKTVAFSAMRFTYLRPIPTGYVYAPILYNNFPAVTLTNAWTADPAGSPRTVFQPGEALSYFASGVNSSSSTVTAELKLSLSGPCNAGIIFDGTQDYASGTWTTSKSASAPSCLGVFTLTVTISNTANSYTLDIPFIVSASTVALKNIPAFDKCDIPTLTQMQTWWDHSPYAAINLYMGGESLADCSANLDAFWVLAASQQGWTFIPTWVGLQAPCYGYKHAMSSNASTAHTQGRNSADAAADAAARLGFDAQSVLYFDLENYANANATSACRNAVKSFINGWVERLHERGALAGVYGGDCGSYVNDWWTISHVPDDVWIANWYTNPHFDANASVYDLTCLTDDNRWAGRRIRQYAGEFKDTYGGLSMTIDADVVNGEVTAIPLTQLAAISPGGIGASGEATSSSLAAVSTGENLKTQDASLGAFQPLTGGHGWVQAGSRLFWRSGEAWREITPPRADTTRLLTAFFLDARQGWALTQDSTTSALDLFTTQDAGVAWTASRLPIPDGPPVVSASMGFLDPQTGWLSLKLASGSSFSLGVLYKTADGGKTWAAYPLPIAGPVRFADPKRGWIAGGPAGDELYSTRDGGASWQPLALTSGMNLNGRAYPSLPVFTSDLEGWLAITVGDPLEPYLDLFITTDGGATWAQAGTVFVDPGLVPAGPLPVMLPDKTHILLAGQGSPLMYTLPPAGSSARPLLPGSKVSGLPAGVVQISDKLETASWALSQEGSCSGYKPKAGELIPADAQTFQCSSSARLWESADGGVSWTEITPAGLPDGN